MPELGDFRLSGIHQLKYNIPLTSSSLLIASQVLFASFPGGVFACNSPWQLQAHIYQYNYPKGSLPLPTAPAMSWIGLIVSACVHHSRQGSLMSDCQNKTFPCPQRSLECLFQKGRQQVMPTVHYDSLSKFQCVAK